MHFPKLVISLLLNSVKLGYYDIHNASCEISFVCSGPTYIPGHFARLMTVALMQNGFLYV